MKTINLKIMFFIIACMLAGHVENCLSADLMRQDIHHDIGIQKENVLREGESNETKTHENSKRGFLGQKIDRIKHFFGKHKKKVLGLSLASTAIFFDYLWRYKREQPEGDDESTSDVVSEDGGPASDVVTKKQIEEATEIVAVAAEKFPFLLNNVNVQELVDLVDQAKDQVLNLTKTEFNNKIKAVLDLFRMRLKEVDMRIEEEIMRLEEEMIQSMQESVEISREKAKKLIEEAQEFFSYNSNAELKELVDQLKKIESGIIEPGTIDLKAKELEELKKKRQVVRDLVKKEKSRMKEKRRIEEEITLCSLCDSDEKWLKIV